ncbi:MAG: manganese oxidase, partial [Acidobacteriota bacterium]|nr:manganese oxidase [Acidobacteriota bacterium]
MSLPRHRVALAAAIFLIFGSLNAIAQSTPTPACSNTVTANVSALDQPFLLNRLGAWMVEGMVYALDRDVVPINPCPAGTKCSATKGNARLRDGKRPRPLVLRVNRGDCLSIHFTNLLSETPASYNKGIQTATRQASIHVAGMQLVKSIKDDGSYVGVNPTSLVKPGESITYLLRATEEGTFLLNSEGAPWGGLNFPNDGAQVTAGLFGAVNVEPKESIWIRSQVTHDEMMKSVDKTKGNNGFTPLGQPLLNFDSPVLRILNTKNEIVYSDLTAVIAGPASNGYQFLDDGDPNTSPVPYEPLRKYPFREFTIEYHELGDPQQAFPVFNIKGASLTSTLQASGDQFAINYGTGGIGAEILANRFGIGPMGSCADCKFEEFFLSSWTVGDPAMVVDYPANAPCNGTQFTSPPLVTTTAANAKKADCLEGVTGNAPAGITVLRKATKALYPEDPSNVYHSYINDRVIFRTLHAGTGVSHVHHLHAHQWFHSPNSDGSTYLDSQLINPGSAYTMEIAHLGSGNLNKVVGDSIFHCHFYPHFAAGMWAHWRSHDVFEIGTELEANGHPKAGWNRAQPDGEIADGTPIPALVPMPSLPMAPVPARVRIVSVADPNNPAGPPVGYRVETNPADLAKNINPGYPFFIPGVAGMRAPHPPMDFAVQDGKTLDGGLPRHIMINAKVRDEKHNYLDFSKDLKDVNAYQLPEDGTDVEKVAMAYHAQCTHPTFTSTGAAGLYRTNGRPPVSGAPYADPGLISESDSTTCQPVTDWITYRAAVIETDAVINKLGWHYPQTRLLTLWEDVKDTLSGKRPPEPFFFRG